MTTPLQKAARALIQQWDSPGFIVDDEIAELHKALADELQQTVEPVAFKQFLSDVITAAGLVTHGKQCKALGERISDGAFQYMLHPPQQVAVTSGERAELIAAHQELNMSNYGPDDVDELNDWANRAYDMLARAQQAKQVPLTEDEITNWYASENGLEECNMSYYPDFEKVVRAVERRIGGEA